MMKDMADSIRRLIWYERRGRTKAARASPRADIPPMVPCRACGCVFACVQLLYLNEQTFMDREAGDALADEVRLRFFMKSKGRNLQLILVHETREEHGGCEFEHFFDVTPPDLIHSGGLLITARRNAAHMTASTPCAATLP